MALTFLKQTDPPLKTHSLALRWQVFVCEQGVLPSEEVDDSDLTLPFYEAWETDRLLATLRRRDYGDGIAKFERVAVASNARGRGIGARLMRYAMAEARSDGFASALLEAQTRAIPFYERLGFAAFGPEFMDARIPHRKMKRALHE